jgi:uncharacterized protein (DUF2141 family)
VSSFNNNKGQVILDIFKSKNGYPMETSSAILRLKSSISKNEAVFIVELPEGEYAFALIHDANLNDKLDQNFLGIPKEGAAASNNAKGFMSPPSYEQAKFILDKATVSKIEMLYF